MYHWTCQLITHEKGKTILPLHLDTAISFIFIQKTQTLVICELPNLNTHLKQKVTYGNHWPNEGRKNKKRIHEMHHPAKNNTTRPIPNHQNLFTFWINPSSIIELLNFLNSLYNASTSFTATASLRAYALAHIK